MINIWINLIGCGQYKIPNQAFLNACGYYTQLSLKQAYNDKGLERRFFYWYHHLNNIGSSAFCTIEKQLEKRNHITINSKTGENIPWNSETHR